MKRKPTRQSAILRQVALSLIMATWILFSANIAAQDTKISAQQQTNSVKRQLRTPEDDPSFNHEGYSFSMGFSSWVASQIKYPAKALKDKVQGWVHVGYTVDLNGTISNVKINAAPDPELGEAVANAVKSSPGWMPAKNKGTATTYKSSINIKFEIPERVISSQDIPVFVVGEIPAYRPAYQAEELHRTLDEGQMPQFPQAKDATLETTDAAIREWVEQHLKYPGIAVKEKLEGTVTVRFIVTKSGKLEDFTIIKSIHPLLDAEALRVLSLMPDWKPAMQGGEPRDVYYYTEVSFKLPK
jgi:TonB family protein